MKVVILYRRDAEYARAVETFVHDFAARHDAKHLDVIDADSRDGIATAGLYDIQSYPTILALRDDGSVLHSWEGNMLPLMDEVAYYTTNAG